nr:MAG TPA: hypothetical protein [Caudoviricetes sp.]
MSDQNLKANIKFVTNWINEYPNKMTNLVNRLALAKLIHKEFNYPILKSLTIEDWYKQNNLRQEDTITYVYMDYSRDVNANFIFLNQGEDTRLVGVFLVKNICIYYNFVILMGDKQTQYLEDIDYEVNFIKQSDLTKITDRVKDIKLVYRFMERRVNYELLIQLFKAGFKENIRMDLEIHSEGKMAGYRLFSGKMSSLDHSLKYQEPEASSLEDPTYITLLYIQSFHNRAMKLIKGIK